MPASIYQNGKALARIDLSNAFLELLRLGKPVRAYSYIFEQPLAAL
jgi:hypothetical protein